MARQVAKRDLGSALETSLYDTDFYAWTKQVASQLRRRRIDEVDVDHAAEEIEDMGKRDARELDSRMLILLVHLLKWQLQAEERSRSWRATIRTQRRDLGALLRMSPSLR